MDILLVEDDQNLSFVIKDNLEENGYDVTCKSDGESALRLARNKKFDLLLLDVMLPLMDGFSLAKQLRKEKIVSPIIFLTARGMKKDKLKGFEIGADDYITKPFDLEELLMRIKAVMRRSKSAQMKTYQIGLFLFTPGELSLQIEDTKIKLTKKECDLLEALSQRMNTAVKREDLLLKIWGDDDYFNGRSMDVYLSKLRKYLKADPNIKIENLHSVGFKLCIDE